MQTADVSINKYLLWFSLVYFASSLVFGMVVSYLDLETNSFLGLIILMLSALITVQLFVNDHRRVLTRRELRYLSFWSWLASVLISVIELLAVFAYSFYEIYGMIAWLDVQAELSALLFELSIDLHALYAIIAVVLLVFWGLTRLAYGFANKAFTKQLARTDPL
ncbi:MULTISPECIES: ABZJ_00895 family protein [unclassified Agarivorans]|uniref:ABZJ_00895 family protein n=1 Tax=unclassified Agarivorans TaxID=2636026 RepID=UPI0026E23D79|nr:MULTISPECIES: ABZJ_00895 family protein [unclassified Agarivorans]MDO6686781.1 ABZJ_00895 family protein [Agarivorans sp. 3_MG-2023]MDO6716489.1 ABZJ_00895 family protein [Agarivorans sp. 2_MG-2023]